ncbi:hypothetical protein [Nostoc sp. LPT]|nr:hypothetical protein [Nostoc sp. LPT]
MIEMAENAKKHLPHFTNAAFDIVAIAASAGHDMRHWYNLWLLVSKAF